MKGQLYVVSAPSGAGKTSLVTALVDKISDVIISVSHTTRPSRDGEEDGKHYHFIDTKQFKNQIQQGDFLEYAEVFDNYYGTSSSAVDALLAAGKDVILEIDWQGAAQICQSIDNVVSIFILPPSCDELEVRLKNRCQDSDEVIQRRMSDAMSDMSHCGDFDYIVVNNDFDVALQDLISIFRSKRLMLERVMACEDEFIQGLLKSET